MLCSCRLCRNKMVYKRGRVTWLVRYLKCLIVKWTHYAVIRLLALTCIITHERRLLNKTNAGSLLNKTHLAVLRRWGVLLQRTNTCSTPSNTSLYKNGAKLSCVKMTGHGRGYGRHQINSGPIGDAIISDTLRVPPGQKSPTLHKLRCCLVH